MNKKEKDYWHSRMNSVIDDNVREKEIAKIYSSQYRNIEKSILRLYDKATSEEITQRSDLYKLQHFQDILKSIEKQNKTIKNALQDETVKTLKATYKGAFKEVSDMLGTADSLTGQNDKMLNGVLKTKWSGENWSRRIWKNTDHLSGRIKADVVTSIVSGASRDTLVKTLMDDYNAGFNDADRLIRTETAHCVNQAQLDIYKADGIEYVEWSAGEDEKMCKVCGKLHGKKFKVSEAPTIAHPRCRCTLIPVIPDDWTAKKKPKTVDKSAKSGIIRNEQESSPRKTLKGDFSVDWSKVQSEDYRRRLLTLSDNEKVVNSIETRVKWALNNRNKSKTEELYAISLRDGKEVSKIIGQKNNYGVTRTAKFTSKLNKADALGDNILLIHNHPRGLPPSIGDINALLGNKNVSGITAGHDGSIYYYTRSEREISEDDWNIAMKHFNKYTECTAMEKSLEILSKKYGFTVIKL